MVQKNFFVKINLFPVNTFDISLLPEYRFPVLISLLYKGVQLIPLINGWECSIPDPFWRNNTGVPIAKVFEEL
jgi:hypothetical protein